jgi:hypothetical protein
MDKTMLDDDINASNAEILPTLNGTVLFTHAKPAIEQHLDTHQKPVKDVFLMMRSTDIMILKDIMMATSQESVDKHVLFTYVYFSTI